ncbi:hypothetical protein GDO78_010570 [Eleutherodactylus coqui]|uniref:Uncharacterized protein n=1 Tax=Eleutherodactylus coqui TaxID=57060 RepID=A0A8J6K7E4_ELECQ|nr:hypothetical protein GDO78_010570 [Eleutherodactylus coqui]
MHNPQTLTVVIHVSHSVPLTLCICLYVGNFFESDAFLIIDKCLCSHLIHFNDFHPKLKNGHKVRVVTKVP